MSFFEPSPVLMAFIFAQRFVFFEVLAVLAMLRLIVGQGLARVPAFVTCGLCAAAIFATFAPALNLHTPCRSMRRLPSFRRWAADWFCRLPHPRSLPPA